MWVKLGLISWSGFNYMYLQLASSISHGGNGIPDKGIRLDALQAASGVFGSTIM